MTGIPDKHFIQLPTARPDVRVESFVWVFLPGGVEDVNLGSHSVGISPASAGGDRDRVAPADTCQSLPEVLMDRKQIDGFFERMEGDSTLRAAFIEFAREHGASSLADQLSEGDLESVSGGIDTVPLPERPMFRAPARGPAMRGTKGIIDTNT